MFRILKEEYYFYSKRAPKGVSDLLFALYYFLVSYQFRIVVLIRVRHKLPIPQFMISHYLLRTFGVEISPKAIIGKRIRFSHLPGIVIGRGSKIGDDCLLFQGVLLGQVHNRFPTIGNHVTICANACVLGGITIGDNVIILANSVVTHDIPSNSVVGGIPAKIIKRKDNLSV